MCRNFADAVVGGIREPDAALFTRGSVDGVVSGADPTHNADVRERGQHAIGDRRVLQQNGATAAAVRDDLVLSLALCGHHIDSGLVEQRTLELDIGIVVVGE